MITPEDLPSDDRDFTSAASEPTATPCQIGTEGLGGDRGGGGEILINKVSLEYREFQVLSGTCFRTSC